MVTNDIRLAFRKINRSKLYTLLHILGLGLAITCGLIIYQYITFHSSYDKHHAKASTTYKLVSDIVLKETSYNEGVSYAMYKSLAEDVSGVDLVAYAMTGQDLTFHYRGYSFSSNKKAAFVDENWFSLFDFNWLSGSPEALNKPNTIALQADVARKIFGEAEPMGQVLVVENKVPLTVVGILDDESYGTGVKSDFYISQSSINQVMPDTQESFFSMWGYMMGTNQIYVSLTDGTSPRRIEKILQSLTKEAVGTEAATQIRLKLKPLTDLHFDPQYGGTMSRALLITLGGIGLAIIAMALVNYVQLSLAQYAQRSVELGTRKALGGNSLQLFVQYIVESGIIIGMAILLASVCTMLGIPLANRFLFIDEPIANLDGIHLFGAATIAWLVISLVSGLYPAWLILRMDVVRALRGGVKLNSVNGRNLWIIIQHTISLSLLICTIAMARQVHLLQTTDIGFDRESVLMISLPKEGKGKKQWKAFLDSQREVLSYSFCLNAPANHAGHGGTLRYADRSEWESWIAKTTFADSAYIRTFDIKLLEGRNFRPDAAVPEYLINETMAKQLGANHLSEVLDRPLLFGGMYDQEEGTIVGVVADYNTHSLHGNIEPTVMGYNEARMQSIAVKVRPRSVAAFVNALEIQWEKYYASDALEYHFVDEQIAHLYVAESIQQRFIWIASIVAILISVLGLIGLISLQVVHRTKEIGVRKVLGASAADIVILLSKNFVKMVIIAMVIASPIAWWGLNHWLEGFAYKIDIQWWMFLVAGIIGVGIAISTVSVSVIRAAIANPVKSLRDE